MSGTEWFCGVQLGGVKLPAEFPAARNSKSMVHAGTGRWRQKNGRPMLIVGSRLAVYRMAVVEVSGYNYVRRNLHCDVPATYTSPLKTNTYCRRSGRQTRCG